jgi:transcriptional regulator with XRE-family HTH domain
MLTAAQLKAARALVGWEQRALAEASGISVPTVQRMETSNGNVRGVVDTLMKVMTALEKAGVEFIHEGTASHGGGRGVRLRRRAGE